jgi:DNA helicase HerA-like ATPase
MEAMLIMLTQYKKPNNVSPVDGFLYLKGLRGLHSPDSKAGFEKDIVNNLREGKIQIVDLSQGNPLIQRKYSEKICIEIFVDSISKFTKNEPNNYIQFYFEEAHNLFPKKEDKNLSQIYNRIAKEGAKLNLGLIYATQEVSSISSNILKTHKLVHFPFEQYR